MLHAPLRLSLNTVFIVSAGALHRPCARWATGKAPPPTQKKKAVCQKAVHPEPYTPEIVSSHKTVPYADGRLCLLSMMPHEYHAP